MNEQKIVTQMQSIGTTDEDYKKLLTSMKDRIMVNTERSQRLFKTDCGKHLFQVFLDNLPDDMYQHYNCNTCRHFVNRYGGLVTINENGIKQPILWPIDEDFGVFNKAINAVFHVVAQSKIIAAFYSDHCQLGTPVTENWVHMSAIMPAHLVTAFANKKMAQSVSDFENVSRALSVYSIDVVETANTLICSGALYRSGNIKNTCKLFLALLKNTSEAGNSDLKRNMIWHYVTNSSATHIRSSVLGTLLDDIKEGLPQKDIISRFNSKMDPLAYQRPQAAPSTGNIKRADQLFKELGITAKSLKRRYATLDDLEDVIWTPRVKKDEPTVDNSSIFGDLLKDAKDAPKTTKLEKPIDRGTMTWNKFYAEILPHATNIGVVLNDAMALSFATFVTAEYPDEPCIFRHGNNVTHYMYQTGRASMFFAPGILVITARVNAICYDAAYWAKELPGEGNYGVNLILEGAKDYHRKDSANITGGSAIFPETLIPSLHEVRSTIAQYSEKDNIAGFENAGATGLRIQRGIDYSKCIKLIVKTDTMGILSMYIDRWE